VKGVLKDLGFDLIKGISAKIKKSRTRIIIRRIKAFSKELTLEAVQKRVSRVKHHIHVGDATPIFQRPRRTPLTYQQIMKEHIDELLKTGLIQPGSGAWASPVVMVKKKDGTLRFCVDYMKLNQITKKDVYPLPRIDDILDALNGAKYFSSFDFLSGYWQIEMDDLDKEKTGFITSTFQRAMDDLLRRFKWAFCLVYIDDVIVYSKTEEDHLKHIEMFLNLIEENGALQVIRARPVRRTYLF
jgi:hypothetical protein